MNFIQLPEEAGCKALEAANSDQAIPILESRDDIQAVLTDVNGHFVDAEAGTCDSWQWAANSIDCDLQHRRLKHIDFPVNEQLVCNLTKTGG
jgi:hypothetical protein